MVKLTKVQKGRVAKLVAALRSGEYKQGRGQLRDGDKFCCLGVACEVFRKTARKGRWDNDFDADVQFVIGGEQRYGELPEAVMSWFGFESTDPEIASKSLRPRASQRNDYVKESFAKIADRFEKVYLGESA